MPPEVKEKPTTVVHCSDLHFGHGFLPDKADQFLQSIDDLNPDAVIVSGDLTMRGRTSQYRAARHFLKQIKAPLLVIPGNHDVPLYNLYERLAHPFRNYRTYIEDLNQGPLVLPYAAFYGVNTVNPLRHQEGVFRRRDLNAVGKWLANLPDDLWRVIVVHQHFADVKGHERPGELPKALSILARLSAAGAHAILHGHTHYNSVVSSAEFFPQIARPLALVCVGTPTSRRVRGEALTNNYNILEFTADSYAIHQCDWNAETKNFAVCKKIVFDRAFYNETPGT